MVKYDKWATITLVPGADPSNLPVKRMSDVIKQLKKEGYIITSNLL